MKFHWGDFLDRESGHWAIIPNAERFNYHFEDIASAPKSTTILTITKNDQNWETAAKLPFLEELTLDNPNPAQLEFVSQLWRIKRLRISHARPKTLDFLSRLDQLEELVLEYVSKFTDLSPIGSVKNLRSLYIENLRGVRDFSGLEGARKLLHLSITGTLDWAQPIEDFGFLSSLKRLEILHLKQIRSHAKYPALLPLCELKELQKIYIYPSAFPLEEYAALEANIPNVKGAVRDPVERVVWGTRPVPSDDIRSKLPVEVLKEKYPEVFITYDGRRMEPFEWKYLFLGKGERSISCDSKTAEKRRAAHKARYYAAVNKFKVSQS